jgi:LAGLIDADG DNA endonuclease family
VAHIGEALTRDLVGNTEGRLLVVETLFARTARATPLTGLQRDLVIGSLLGDGYLMPTTAGCCLRVSHGHRQRTYADWKFGIISDYVRTPPRECGRSYYFLTVTHPAFAGLREAFYVQNETKVVPLDLLQQELTAFGLAIWFMDDGAADRRQVRLNAQSFSLDENLGLAEFLHAKFGIAAQLNKDKNRYRLRISAKSTARFVDLVAPHVIPSMQYKLPL